MWVSGTIDMGLSNYYGKVTAFKGDDKFYIQLDNYDGADQIEISEEFYNAIKKEFEK
jgi:hypothetical protein